MLRPNLYQPAALSGKIHVFSVYTDFGLCKRVKWLAGTIAKLAGHRWHCTSETWKLDSLIANGAMRKMLARDAAEADVLMVVVGSLVQRRPELMDWLASLPPRMPLQHGLLIGSLGDDDDKTQELDWTAKQLGERARENNRKFVWHWMGHYDADPSEWMAGSVQTLLAVKQPIREPILMQDSRRVWQAA